MSQCHAHSVAAGEIFHRACEVGFAEAKAGKNAFGLVLGILVSVGGVQRRLARDRFELLRQVADLQAGPFPNRALVRRFLSENHLE